jgi:hypothetical protein
VGVAALWTAGAAADNQLMAAPPPVPRTIRLLRPPSGDAAGLFFIGVGAWSGYYAFREIPCAIGGRGFRVHRIGTRRHYDVRVGRRSECSCECKGFVYKRRCRHVSGLLTLIKHAGV